MLSNSNTTLCNNIWTNYSPYSDPGFPYQRCFVNHGHKLGAIFLEFHCGFSPKSR